MNTLPETLIHKIMLYVSHPCADIMRKCKRAQVENVIVLRTRSKLLPNTKFRTKS